MSRTIRKIFIIWIALALTYYMITNTILDWNAYTQRVVDNIPNFNDLFNEITGAWRELVTDIQAYEEGPIILKLLGTVGDIFKLLVSTLTTPIKAIWYLIKVIIALIPYFNT